jgi:phosphoribosyl 1,2-cyclic phosphate phosphodiesterase
VPTAYFIHMSHQMGLHDVVNPTLPAGMQLAFDQLQITV